MRPNGIGQILQFNLVKILPRLIRVGLYLIDGQQLIGTFFTGFFGEISQQCAQTFAEALV